MQRSMEVLKRGCGAEGFKVDELLERPVGEIVPFARRWQIPLEDMRDICQLLIQRLEQLEVESGRFEELTFLDSMPGAAGPGLPPYSIN